MKSVKATAKKSGKELNDMFQLDEMVDDIKEQARDYLQEAIDYSKEHPVAAFFIGVGAISVISSVIKRII